MQLLEIAADSSKIMSPMQVMKGVDGNSIKQEFFPQHLNSASYFEITSTEFKVRFIYIIQL
jgi:hypothetical protein